MLHQCKPRTWSLWTLSVLYIVSLLVCETEGINVGRISSSISSNGIVVDNEDSNSAASYPGGGGGGYDKNCRIRLLPQIQGCTMGFLQHYRVYQKLKHRQKTPRTGHLCHSYGESLQCLHLAFLQCPPTDVHLDLMEAQLPHPDLMHNLCFTHPKQEVDLPTSTEESTLASEDALTSTTTSTSTTASDTDQYIDSYTDHSETTTKESRNTRIVNKERHLKIVLSQKLTQDSSIAQKQQSHMILSHDDKTNQHLAESTFQASQAHSAPCGENKNCATEGRRANNDNAAMVVVQNNAHEKRFNNDKQMNYQSAENHKFTENTKLTHRSGISKSKSEYNSNHIQQARLTDSTDSSVYNTDSDHQSQANTGTHVLPVIRMYIAVLFPLLILCRI